MQIRQSHQQVTERYALSLCRWFLPSSPWSRHQWRIAFTRTLQRGYGSRPNDWSYPFNFGRRHGGVSSAKIERVVPTENVKHLVNMMKDVHKWKRRNDEAPFIFARGFKGLASLYMNNANSCDSAQDSQLFAMILLENAALVESTTNHIILQLISKTSSKPSNPLFEKMSISQLKINTTLQAITSISSSLDQDDLDLNTLQNVLCDITANLSRFVLDHERKIFEINVPRLSLDATMWAVIEVSAGNDSNI